MRLGVEASSSTRNAGLLAGPKPPTEHPLWQGVAGEEQGRQEEGNEAGAAPSRHRCAVQWGEAPHRRADGVASNTLVAARRMEKLGVARASQSVYS